MLFYACPRSSALCTLLVPVQYLLVPDNIMNMTILNFEPCCIHVLDKYNIIDMNNIQVLSRCPIA